MRDRERNNWLLLAFFAFILITRIYYFDYFYVPDSDFFNMRKTAIAVINLELPESYQRLPLYSCLMGLLSTVLPGKEPILFAAEIINLLSFIISCLFLYLISERFLGKAAFLVVYLFAMHPLTVKMTVQPRAEMLTVMFILIGVYLAYSMKKSSYLAAFFGSLTRYEGFFLIPSLIVKDFIFSKRKFITIILGLLSSIGLLVWIILNFQATGHINPYYQHFSSATEAAGIKFIILAVFTLISFINPKFFSFISLKVITIAVFIFTAIGFYYFFKQCFKFILPIFFFFIGCFFLNMVVTSVTPEHFFMIFWIFILTIIGGIKYTANFMFIKSQKLESQSVFILNNKFRTIFYAIIFVLSLLLLFLNVTYAKITNEYLLFYFMSFSILIWFTLKNFRINSSIKSIIFILIIIVSSFISNQNILAIQKTMKSIKYVKAELRLIGEWFSKNSKGAEKIVVSEPWVAGYYANPSKYKNFISLGSFNADSYESFLSELKEKKIKYVAWDYHQGRERRSVTHSHYYNKYKMNLIVKLKDGQDVEHFKLIKTFYAGTRYAHIYEFIP